MDQANAFIGKTERPSVDEIAAALGPAATIWDELIHRLDEKYGVNIQHWSSYSEIRMVLAAESETDDRPPGSVQ